MLAIGVLAVAAWLGWKWFRRAEPKRVIASHAAPEKPTIPPPRPLVSTHPPAAFPRPARDTLEAQIALDRLGISPGSLDGRIGPQTRAALRAFQRQERLPVTGELDATTESHLTLARPPFCRYVVTSNDLEHLEPVSRTWLGKSRQRALDYESILERVAEESHSYPDLIRHLNPGADWTNMMAETVLRVPDVSRPESPPRAAYLRIVLSGKVLEAFDAESNLLAHFPCSIARRVEKRPVGELRVTVIAPNPNYTFDPRLFPESREAQISNRKLVLPPGPNNPVGTVWIGLDKPGYGIHGTPKPELVGRTESHGCFRLANWNAEYLMKLVRVGTPVYVEP